MNKNKMMKTMAYAAFGGFVASTIWTISNFKKLKEEMREADNEQQDETFDQIED